MKTHNAVDISGIPFEEILFMYTNTISLTPPPPCTGPPQASLSDPLPQTQRGQTKTGRDTQTTKLWRA